MQRLKVALLYALCSPWDGGVCALSLMLFLLGARGPRWHLGVAWLDATPGSWLAVRWRYSTTFGHVVLLQPGLRGTSVEAHELVHVRQFEGAVCSLWLAAASAWGLSALAGMLAATLVVALLGPWWSYFGASLAAWLRGTRPYLDNHFERHARAEVEVGDY